MFWTGHLQKNDKINKTSTKISIFLYKFLHTHTHTHTPFPWHNSHCGPGPPHYQGFMITQTDHIQRLFWRVINPKQRPLPNNTQHKQETTIHAPGRIQTCSPSKQVTTDPCLRPRSHYAGSLSKNSCKLFTFLCRDSAFYLTSLLHASFHNLDIQIKF